MQWYERDVCELTAHLAARPVADAAVLYGSSSIRLWTTMAADLKDERAVNAGFGGSTLEACAFFFEQIVPPLQPASLLVYAGDNDLGDGRSPEDVLRSFRLLAAQVDLQCGAIPFGFIEIKPSPAREDILHRIQRANTLIRFEIERRAHGFYVPVLDAMLRDGKPRPELFLDDGLHLGPKGYDLWTKLLEPFRNELFDASRGGRDEPPPSRSAPPQSSS
jgi:lysophospholipase L1-like esterase